MVLRRASFPPVDAALAVALAAWGVAEALSFSSAAPAPSRVAFAVAATVPVALRSIAPVPVAAWLVAAFLFDTVAVVLPVDAVTPLPSVPVAVYGLVVCATSRRLALLLGALAVPGVPAAAAVVARDAPVTLGDAVALAVAVAVAVLAGAAVRARREAAARAQRVAAAARAAREHRLRAGVVAERQRIAGELRAIVSRDLGDMAARLSTDATHPAALMDVADGVQRIASEAVVEMQRLLRVLRADGELAQPGTIDRLADDARARGRDVALSVGGTAAALAPGGVVAVVLAAAAVAGEALAAGGGGATVVLTVVAALVVVPLVVRRRAPLQAALALAAGQVGAVLAGVLPDRPWSTVPVAIFGAAAVARHARTAAQAGAGGVALMAAALAVTAMTLGHPTPATDLPIVAYLVVGGWLVGWRARTAEGSVLQARADEAQAAAEHDTQVRSALDGVRRGVARDLHDVVAHGVSLVAVLAGAARATAGRDPARSRACLARAADAVADTRHELSRLTGMLRAGGDEPPAMGLGDLALLAEQARAGGQDVRLAGALDAHVPPGVAASAYRIVQEAVTNARKHAAGAPVRIDVALTDAALHVTVVNPGDPAAAPECGSGHGIVGMGERARVLDGALTAGWRDDRHFVVRAWLPLYRASDPVERRAMAPTPDERLMEGIGQRIK